MSAITIVPSQASRKVFDATYGNHKAQGRTAGEALDALTAMLGEDTGTTIVVLQSQKPDIYFTADQQTRLKTLMARFHEEQAGRDKLSVAEHTELKQLIEAELEAAEKRSQALLDALK